MPVEGENKKKKFRATSPRSYLFFPSAFELYRGLGERRQALEVSAFPTSPEPGVRGGTNLEKSQVRDTYEGKSRPRQNCRLGWASTLDPEPQRNSNTRNV
jgi:hypothetical protein